MSDSGQEPWSNSPNAPRISHSVYISEKTSFAGTVIGAIAYGFVIALFFQCMGVLFDPVHRARSGIKWWGLVAHTVIMFALTTISNAFVIYIESISYIDNREFPGNEFMPPGPIGYQLLILRDAIVLVPTIISFVNNWLADALLLYRCHVTYTMQYWATTFPAVMYLASIGMGIGFIYESSRPVHSFSLYVSITNFAVAYYSVSVGLNVLLTLMIVTRLVMHSRNLRKAMGSSTGTIGMYNAIIVLLIESCALYTVTFLIFVGLWAAESPFANVFTPLLVQSQAIATFLIIQRSPGRNSSTVSESVTSGSAGSIRFSTYIRSMGATGTGPDEYPMNPLDARGQQGKTHIDPSHVTVETAVDLYRDN